MAVPSYAYLKLKISRPAGVITVEVKAQRALDCDHSSIELYAVAVTAAELKELCLSTPPSSTSLAMPTMPDTL
jgi:hypothetical protein